MSWQPGITLEQMEMQTILTALRFYQGNRTHTANALNIALRTLTNKISEYKSRGVAVPPPPPIHQYLRTGKNEVQATESDS